MKNMTFEEFKKQIAEEIKAYLPGEFADASVNLQKVTKNNDTILDAVTITNPGSNISPTIYLNSFYRMYQDGKTMPEIMKLIAEIRMDHDADVNLDLKEIMDYEKVKGKIFPKLVGTQNNAELLSQRPHKLIDDLAVTYSIHVGEGRDGSMSIPITQQMLDHYGVSVDELHRAAVTNMPDLMPSTFLTMNEVMNEMLLSQMMDEFGGDREAAEQMLASMMPADNSMYVLTNSQKHNGAAAILDTQRMDEISERLEDGFYILPSSIHELIIIPRSLDISLQDLESMVCEVNVTEVGPEERLSDHVYAYDSETHELYRADQEKEHLQAKENDKGDEKDVMVGLKAEAKGNTLIEAKAEGKAIPDRTLADKASVKDKLTQKQKEVPTQAKAAEKVAEKAVKKDKVAVL